MISRFRLAAVCVLLAAQLLPVAVAHHSQSLVDLTKEVVIAGTVKDFQWSNPHIWIQLLVPDKSGNSVEWGVEGASPRQMARYNIKRTTLKPGDKIELTVNPLRSGGVGGGFVRVKLPDGQVLGLAVGEKRFFTNPGDPVAK
jgi:Family of unknown function (DUF6152)